ncbi:MAG TPA: hypothetical protein VE088_04670 [Gaiellaceae bacterium]|nr:hypothetical protein [Gaiellaceae bacterium]
MSTSFSVSPQIRIVALVGVLLIAAAGGGLFLMRRSNQAAVTVIPPTPSKTAPAPAPTSASIAANRFTGLTPSAEAAIHGTLNPPVRQERQTRQRQHNRVNALLPAALREQLAQHRIVVVSAYNPQAKVDGLSVAEARAGAQDANVGFVLVNVLDDRVAGPLTALLPSGDLLPNPGILVYRAPGKLVYRFDGYLDREAVAQAAANAKAGLDTAPAAEASTP